MTSFEPGDDVWVLDGWGNTLFEGGVHELPSPYSAIIVHPARGRLYLVSTTRLAKMSAENPWADAPRDMLESALVTQAATIARLTTDNEGLLSVIDMQLEAITAPTATASDVEWGERLQDLLELYLVRTVGARRPLHIADPDLRALVSHILD